MIFCQRVAAHLLAVSILCIEPFCAAQTQAASSELRGFGKIEQSSSQIDHLGLTTFTCQTPDKAILLMHKFGRDMEQTATVSCQWERVSVGGSDANVLVREAALNIQQSILSNRTRRVVMDRLQRSCRVGGHQ